MKKRVIKPTNLSTKAPFMSALVVWLALDHWNAPDWVYGAFGVLYAILFINWIVSLITEKWIDIFSEDEEDSLPKHSSFQERLRSKQYLHK